MEAAAYRIAVVTFEFSKARAGCGLLKRLLCVSFSE